MPKMTTCLWFDGRAEEAAAFYIAAFRACGQPAEITETMRYNDAFAGQAGKVMTVAFTLADQEFVGLNGGPQYSFTPAISLTVKCADQAEVDRFWEALGDGGQPGPCGWLTDRFGASWQVVPTPLIEMLRDGNAEQGARMMRAMFAMQKLDIAMLRAAWQGSAAS